MTQVGTQTQIEHIKTDQSVNNLNNFSVSLSEQRLKQKKIK